MYLGFLMMLCFQPIFSIGNGTDLKIVVSLSAIGLRRSWQPTPGFLPGESHRGALQATVHGVAQSQTGLE